MEQIALVAAMIAVLGALIGFIWLRSDYEGTLAMVTIERDMAQDTNDALEKLVHHERRKIESMKQADAETLRLADIGRKAEQRAHTANEQRRKRRSDRRNAAQPATPADKPAPAKPAIDRRRAKREARRANS